MKQFVSVAFVFFVTALRVHAQFTVTDPGLTTISKIRAAADKAFQSKAIQTAQSGLQWAQKQKQVLDQSLMVYRNIERGLQNVRNIQGLKIGDAVAISSNALGQSTDPNDYIPSNMPGAQNARDRMRQFYMRGPTSGSVIELYHNPSVRFAARYGRARIQERNARVRMQDEVRQRQEVLVFQGAQLERRQQLAADMMRRAEQMRNEAIEAHAALMQENTIQTDEGIRLLAVDRQLQKMEQATMLEQQAQELLEQPIPEEIKRYAEMQERVRTRKLLVQAGNISSYRRTLR